MNMNNHLPGILPFSTPKLRRYRVPDPAKEYLKGSWKRLKSKAAEQGCLEEK